MKRFKNYAAAILTLLREADRMVHGGTTKQCLVVKIINIDLAYHSLKLPYFISLI